MADPLTTEIEWLWRGIRAIRIARYGDGNMPLEIKGLKGMALTARGHIDAIKGAYGKFNSAAPMHVADVESLTKQIAGLQDDLEFAANTLGNSTERLDEGSPAVEPQKPFQAGDPTTGTTEGQ